MLEITKYLKKDSIVYRIIMLILRIKNDGFSISTIKEMIRVIIEMKGFVLEESYLPENIKYIDSSLTDNSKVLSAEDNRALEDIIFIIRSMSYGNVIEKVDNICKILSDIENSKVTQQVITLKP